MSAMAFREPDEARWVGERPGHKGTQVIKSIYDVSNTTTILYTVTSNKTLYLCTARLSCYPAAAGHIQVFVRNTSDVIQYYIDRAYVLTTTVFSHSVRFWPPLEIPAGFDVCVSSGDAGCYAHGLVFGWEE